MSANNSSQAAELLGIAEQLVQRARKAGADVAEASCGASWELSATVRLGQPELLQEAGQRGASLRVIRNGQVAATATSDLSEPGIARCVSDALELSELSQPDPFAGPADAALIAQGELPDLELYDEQVETLDADYALARCEEAERLSLAQDPRLKLSEGASFSRVSGERALVLSSGFAATRRGSYVSLSVSPVVEDEGAKKRRGSYWTANRRVAALEPVSQVAERAAERALRQLGARKVATGEFPVVFDAEAAGSLLSCFSGCVLGGSIWRKSSYLASRLGTEVANRCVSIVDDPLIVAGPGSRAFDGEGVLSRTNPVVEDGVLRTFLLDSYSARKLGKQTTGSAGRSGGGVGPCTSNFILKPGSYTRDALIAATPRGLLVTDMMGFGFNSVTGDFSRGASGFWIEDGKLAFPVSEVTISSNLDTMLKGIDALADDLQLKTACAAPTLRVATMTVGGQ